MSASTCGWRCCVRLNQTHGRECNMARSGCLYGSTGTYKTTAIAHFSRYIAETTGKATLLLSADGGGWTPCDEEIAVEMIRPYRLDVGHDRFLPSLVVI